jgi:hypothetical protein
MMFPQSIEKWRPTVQLVFLDLKNDNPHLFSASDALGLAIGALVDTTLALIQKESFGNDQAVGDSGDSIGLMQLNFGAGLPQDLGFTGVKEDLFDPYWNIYYGAKDLLSKLNRYKDLNKAILAYNAGSVRLNEAGQPINITYLNDVLTFLGQKKISWPPRRLA